MLSLSRTVAAVLILPMLTLPLVGQEKKAPIKGKLIKKPLVAPKALGVRAKRAVRARAMIIPGVNPKANEELLRLSISHNEQVANVSDPEKLAAVFRETHDAVDRLLDQYGEDTEHPRTRRHLIERKVLFYTDAIHRKVADAEQQLDLYIETLQKNEPKSEETAVAVGMRLYHLQILPGQPNAAKETLIDEYLRDFRGKSYAGQLVFMYGMILARADGPDARLQWLEAHVDDIDERFASSIRRELARAKLVGSVAELVGSTVDGSEFDLKKLRGKVVLLDFWATWCGPCVKELPAVKKVYDEHRDEGFEVVGFSLDRTREPLEKYLANYEYNWTQVYLPDEEDREQILDQFGVTGIPATFLIDQQGKITAMNLRGHEQITRAVSKLLGSTSAELPAGSE